MSQTTREFGLGTEGYVSEEGAERVLRFHDDSVDENMGLERLWRQFRA